MSAGVAGLVGGLLGGLPGAAAGLIGNAVFGDPAKEAADKAQMDKLNYLADNHAEQNKGTQDLLQKQTEDALKTPQQIAQEQTAGLDKIGQQFAGPKDQAQQEREAAASGSPVNSALEDALAQKRQKLYGRETNKLKAQAEFDATNSQMNAQQQAVQRIQQNRQINYQRQMMDYTVALNKKRQENSILGSIINFGLTAGGAVIGGAIGGPQGAAMGANAGGSIGRGAGGALFGNMEQERM